MTQEEKARIFLFQELNKLNTYVNIYNGRPISEHISAVITILKTLTDVDKVFAATYLHYLFMKTKVCFMDIQRENFTDEVLNLLLEIVPDDKHCFSCLRLHTLEAAMIKFADRLVTFTAYKNIKSRTVKELIKHSAFWKGNQQFFTSQW